MLCYIFIDSYIVLRFVSRLSNMCLKAATWSIIWDYPNLEFLSCSIQRKPKFAELNYKLQTSD